MRSEPFYRRFLVCSTLLLVPLSIAGCVRSPATGNNTTDRNEPAAEDGTSTAPPAGNTPGDSAPSDAFREYPLGTLPTTTVRIGEHVFRVWLVQEFDPNRPRACSEGLMHVQPAELADDQGMLFVFSDERVRGFWMLNTVTPLDIAYARMNGTIVKLWQMPPHTLRTFTSIEPAMLALEVKQGTFERLGIQANDLMEIPPEAFVVQP